jgi:hypothetical protein
MGPLEKDVIDVGVSLHNGGRKRRGGSSVYFVVEANLMLIHGSVD